MAGIIPSLFGPTPQELMTLKRAEENKTIQQAGQAYGPKGATGASIGTLLARGANKLFGLEDPAVKQATDVYATIQKVQQELGTDVKDPTKLYPALAKGFSDANLPEMASKVMMEGYDKMSEWEKEKAQINRLNSQAEADLIKAKKDKESPLETKEKYLAQIQTDLAADPTNQLIIDKLDRAKQEVKNEIQSKLSSDALFTQASITLENPKATKEEKDIAQRVYSRILPKVLNNGTAAFETDPNTGTTTIKYLPGSIEYEKRSVALQKGVNLIKSRQGTLQETLSAIDTAITTAGKPYATGFIGKATGFIPGTPGYTLTEGDLTELKAKIGFGELQEMRQNSPTGGALGQVAVQELKYLQNSLGALEPGLGGPKLIENLNKVKKHYEGFLKALDDELTTAQAKQANLAPSSKKAAPSQESAPAQTGDSDYLSIIRGAKKNKEAR